MPEACWHSTLEVLSAVSEKLLVGRGPVGCFIPTPKQCTAANCIQIGDTKQCTAVSGIPIQLSYQTLLSKFQSADIKAIAQSDRTAVGGQRAAAESSGGQGVKIWERTERKSPVQMSVSIC